MCGDDFRTVPAGNLDPGTLDHFMRSDFRVAWNAIAASSDDLDVGGNFMFARQAFGYLELAARTASSVDTDGHLHAFAAHLRDRDPRYFTELPGTVPVPGDFALPSLPEAVSSRQLLTALYDLSRHGLAHVYQQTPATLTDRRQWLIAFAGVNRGQRLEDLDTPDRRAVHLSYKIGGRGDIRLVVCPGLLMLDLQHAARFANTFTYGLHPEYPARPRPKGRRTKKQPAAYEFSADQLKAALRKAGHRETPDPTATQLD